MGVWPRGAQVRRTTGWSIKPLSSSITILQPWRRAFFYLSPFFLTPALDRFFIALASTPLRLLATPTHFTQEVPHMTGMIFHPKQALNHLRDTRQRPQIGALASCLRPGQQHLFQFFLLRRIQTGRTSWVRLGLQGLCPARLQCLFPSAHRGWRSTHQARHLANTLACLEQLPGNLTPDLQFFCTTFGSHAAIIS